MADKRPYEELTEPELRAQVLERPDGRLPPREEAKALIDEWIRRHLSSRPTSVERANLP
jgi:hypothetical protein